MAASMPHNNVASSANNNSTSTSSTSSVSDANDAKVSVKMSVKMPDMKERKHSAKVVRKSKVVYYMADEDLKYLKKKTRYTEGELREWHQNFREECPEGILDKQHIIKIYDEISPFGNSKDFVDNIFRVFDKDGDGTIDFTEFMVATDMTASGTPEEKLRWAFKMYDKDGSGEIDEEEMVQVLGALQFGGSRGAEAAAAKGRRLFAELDINDDGSLTCEEFVKGCMQDPELVRIFMSGGLDPMDD